jgi:hypothetical protein
MRCGITGLTSRAHIMLERTASSQKPVRKEVYAEPVKEVAAYAANTVKVLIAEIFAEDMCRLSVISLINLRTCVIPVKTGGCV